MIRESVRRFSERSCSIKELKRDDDSSKSDRALAAPAAARPDDGEHVRDGIGVPRL
jgi:hypothetical protein